MPDADTLTNLKKYYSIHFPAQALCLLLSRHWDGESRLHKRELCIETADSCYIRWLSVSTPDELRLLFLKKGVEKFHTGAIFNECPIYKKKNIPIQATEREFVIDIDVNDYTTWGVDPNDIDACDRAWPVVACGMKIVQHVLRSHFGFKKFLLVYSGRRGAHLTVYDTRACVLTDQERDAIVSYLQPADYVCKSGRPPYWKILAFPGFSHLFKEHILPFWTEVCLKDRRSGGMGVLDGPLEKEEFMQLFDRHNKQGFVVVASDNGLQMWDKLINHIKQCKNSNHAWSALKETLMCYLWPRLDGAVSKRRNHLSKSIFSVHPKTQRICVPIKGDSLCFKPQLCPKYTNLASGDANAAKLFATYVDTFQHFVDGLTLDKSLSHESVSGSSASRKRKQDDRL